MSVKSKIVKNTAKWLLREICTSYTKASISVDINTIYAALNYAEQACPTADSACKKEHLALFKAEVINYIHTK